VKSATGEHIAAAEYQHVLFERAVQLLGTQTKKRAKSTVKQPAAWPLAMGDRLSRNVGTVLPFCDA